MNCQRFEQVVSDLARGQMIEADVRTEALAHSAQCESCLARLRDEEALTRGLRFLAADMESLGAPDAIELNLRQAFRQRQVPVRVSARGLTRTRYWLVAVAAMLLVAVTAAAMWWRSNVPQEQVAGNETPPKQIEVPAGPTEVKPKEVEYRTENSLPKRQATKSVHRHPATRNTPETTMANHVTNEIATDFVPLGDLNPASLQDGGQIVRVKLRRSALARFGFPVNMDRYNENVKADVLVGADGLARAIRFVQ